MSTRYRVDCTNCAWTGYRRPHPDNECACYSDYAPYCRPDQPGPGCPNGANLHALCPRCRNVRIGIQHNAPVAFYDKGQIVVTPVGNRIRRTKALHRARDREPTPW